MQPQGDLRGGVEIRKGEQPDLPVGVGEDSLPGGGSLQEERRTATRQNLEGSHQHGQRCSKYPIQPPGIKKGNVAEVKVKLDITNESNKPEKKKCC